MKNSIIPLYNSTNRLIVKSKDCYQYDSDGREYIDFESGVWCTNIGHSNEKLNNLIEHQINESIHLGLKFRNHYSEALSIELQRIIGFDNGSSAFLCSGSEAVNMAITLSNHITKRKKILKISNSFLSAYGYGQILPDNNAIVNVIFNDFDSIKSIDFKEISAFVMETGGASLEMVRFPDYDFIKKIVELSKENDCLIIAEEVTTGMGRMGKWFGFQYYNIFPDIVVTGKALGNGYPISGVTVNSKIVDSFEKNPFKYAQSHQNDPLGCAIGLEVIRIIEENKLIDICQKTGQYFKKQLELIHEKHHVKVKAVRARGLMLAFELADCIDGEVINNHLFDSGFVTGFKANTLRFLPPLIIKTSDIDKLVAKLDKLLTNIKATSA